MPTKKRVRQHIMEDRSIQIVRALLPEQWVIREYKPDYGIDLQLETFEYTDREKSAATTLGEMLYLQVKSTEVVSATRVRVYPRRNVEIGPLLENRGQNAMIDVGKVRLETSELLLVQAIGAAVPVGLCLVELSTRRLFYVCLNDLIEKVILPRDPTYHLKRSKVVDVPLRNCISADDPHSVQPLSSYAKRPKLYAAFEKFGYQRHELEYAIPRVHGSPTETHESENIQALLNLVRHFLSVILRYDFWTRMPEWQIVRWSHHELLALRDLVQEQGVENDLARLKTSFLTEPAMRRDPDWVASLDLSGARSHLADHIGQIWHRLWNLGGIYEELVREWLLPTHLALHL